MIDITLKLDKDNKVWEWLESGDNKLINLGHIGTHIDVYNKTEVPFEYFKTNGVIIDCSHYDLDEEIGLESIDGKEINKQDFVMFKTDIQKEHPYGNEIYIQKHHQLSYDLIEYLLKMKVAFIGIDGPGIRRGKEHVAVDIKAEENKTFIIENLDLTNVEVKEGEELLAYTMWIDNPFSTGISTRVILKKI